MAKKQAKNNQKHGAEHLEPHQFKPGQSGNPKGRPKGKTITERMRALLEADDGKVMEAIAKIIIKEAAQGKFNFAKELIDRIDGKVPDKVEAGKVEVVVRYEQADGISDSEETA